VGGWQKLAVSKQHVLGVLHIHRSRRCSSALVPLEQVGAKNRLLVFMGRITHQKG
jgi:hypothetical protein